MMPSWQYRHPLLAGWWIAIAQNVAPKRFHAREARRLGEHQRQMLAESDVPTFALAGVVSEDEPSFAGDAGMMSGGLAVGARGGFGRGHRRPGRIVVSSLSTSQRTPDGGLVRFTSYRRSGAELDERQRAMVVHNFIAGAGLVDDPRVERRELSFTPSISHPLMSVPDDVWVSYVVIVDGERHTFRRVALGEHWLALGVISAVDLAIEGTRFDADPLELLSSRPEGSPTDV